MLLAGLIYKVNSVIGRVSDIDRVIDTFLQPFALNLNFDVALFGQGRTLSMSLSVQFAVMLVSFHSGWTCWMTMAVDQVFPFRMDMLFDPILV